MDTSWTSWDTCGDRLAREYSDSNAGTRAALVRGMRLDEPTSVDRMTSVTAIRHVRAVRPVDFPSASAEWDLPESKRHHMLCELLHQLLAHAIQRRHSIGADQFVYYDASNRRRCLAPDAFVKLDVPDTVFDSWKTWEHGAPELCVEILSPSDTVEKLTFTEKLRRYRALGVRELVAFDIDAPVGERLRVWDRIEGDLVERVVEDETTTCLTLSAHWVLAAGGPDLPVALRLASPGLWLTEAEAERQAKEAAEREVARLRDLIEKR